MENTLMKFCVCVCAQTPVCVYVCVYVCVCVFITCKPNIYTTIEQIWWDLSTFVDTGQENVNEHTVWLTDWVIDQWMDGLTND